MKKTYWVLSIGGTLDKNASGLPTIYYTSDPKVSPGGVPKLLENADAMFIPIEIEIPEAEALTRKHLDEKNRIIGALRDNAKPAPKAMNTGTFVQDVVLNYLKSEVEERTIDEIAKVTCIQRGEVVDAMTRLLNAGVKITMRVVGGKVMYWYKPEIASKPSLTLEDRILLLLSERPGQRFTSAWISGHLHVDQSAVIDALCALVKNDKRLWGERPAAGKNMEYWFEDAKPSVPPEKIVLDYLQQTRGGDSSALFQSSENIARETKLHLVVVQDILAKQWSTGAVVRQSHIDGYLYRAASKPFELTPTVARTSPTYVAVQKALKGNKYRFVSEIAIDAGCNLCAAEDILLELEKEGKAKSYDGLWKKPLLKKPCRIKAKSWREAVIQTLDTQKRPVTEVELEKLVEKRYPDKCAGKSIHGAVGSAVHGLKHVQKHRRFRFEKRSCKVVMWTEKKNG
jgi:hypothetical protein